MYTEEQVQALRKQISDTEAQVHELESNIRFMKLQLKAHNFEVVEARFPGLKEGDLVDVKTFYDVLPWVPGGQKSRQYCTDRLYFKEKTVETWSDPSCMSNVILVFNEVKKDGTPSKRTRNIYYQSIEDITKVTE